jgi:hypothetical protein
MGWPQDATSCDIRDDILGRDLVDRTFVTTTLPGRGGHRYAARPLHRDNDRLHPR